MIGIYKITNPNGMVYIGQSKNIEQRNAFYSKAQCKTQRKLYYSILKYGWENHRFEVIEECNVNELNNREIFHINQHNCISPNGLNLRHGGNIGLISDETKAKMSESHIGSKNIMFGKTHSKEAREKISKTHKGRKLTPERIAQIKSKLIGRVKTPQEIEKLRQSKLGKPRPQSVKDKLRQSKSKPFAISNNSLYMEFESVTHATLFLKCSRKEISKAFKGNKIYKGYNLMYI